MDFIYLVAAALEIAVPALGAFGEGDVCVDAGPAGVF